MTKYGSTTAKPVSNGLAQMMRRWRVYKGGDGSVVINSDFCYFPFEESLIRAIRTICRKTEVPRA
jgi:hypothetical protein